MTWQFLKQCILCFLHEEDCPDIPKQLDLDRLNKLIYKHRFWLIYYTYINKDFTLTASWIKRYLNMTRYLVEVTQQFQQQHIGFAVLKGIPLNQQLYGDQCLRISSDIDVLICPEHVQKAHDCLLSLGYIPKTPLQTKSNDFPYDHNDHKCRIDLHTHAMPNKMMDIGVFDPDKCCEITLQHSSKVTVLKAEYQLLFLCIHGAKHRWSKLQWLIDVAMFYRKIPFSWKMFLTLAQQHQAIRTILEIKWLLETEFGIVLPDVPYTWRDKVAIRCRIYFITHAWSNAEEHHRYINYLLNLYLYPGLSQKFNMVKHMIAMKRCKPR